MKTEHLIGAYKTVRQQTERLCQPLATEDYVIQSIEDVSPPKWHLAHCSWFFETFILSHYLKSYKPFHPSFHHLFNSYYQGIGNPYPRAKRGLLSRPTVEEIYAYRKYIDKHMQDLLSEIAEAQFDAINTLLTLGLHHEQQHQELLLMDVKHNFSYDPNFPLYQAAVQDATSAVSSKLTFMDVEGGLVEIGHRGMDFCFDNELPNHKKFLIPYAIASRLTTNEEYLEFIEAGGYKEPCWWLADGWDCVLKNNWQAPLYWHNQNNEWHVFSLHGLTPLSPAEPVSHISFYEADAYARWRGARLASEEEWEHFVVTSGIAPRNDNFMENGLYHPQPASTQHSLQAQQFFGDLWEWTASPYTPYPGFRPLKGALGEYNGKFMTNQMVLRGGSCATPKSHIRASYRNFFQPEKRWQFSGIRLARTN
ncbi:ergothioneine biosynthesis protein EgtB [Legionella sp.]|uniref:ergothioneine biosynthesis protein EgtB n=1 Tax=Legionella sp. TaxID=459 RepID=UPI000CA7590F|nr:ergothioneine biosynthesis protein EgtB [Legionella sp.]PJE16913.1 MAG: hypothetical protein CK430_02895 [Legionella sp.]